MTLLLIQEVAEYLENASVGTRGTDIFVSSLPESPDNCIALFENSGVEANKYVPLENPSFQVLIRNTSYATGRAKAEDVKDVFLRKNNVELTTGGTHALFIHPVADVGYIGRDKNDRHEWSINFNMRIRTS